MSAKRVKRGIERKKAKWTTLHLWLALVGGIVGTALFIGWIFLTGEIISDFVRIVMY